MNTRHHTPLEKYSLKGHSEKAPARKGNSYAFVFVCQQGDLEGMSLLLAASLRRFVRCEYEMIAAIPLPEKTWGRPSKITMRLLKQMGVRIEYIVNRTDPGIKGNALTNKIYCLDIPTSMSKLVFLDSDVLCMREFHDAPHFTSPFSAAPTFKATARGWGAIYAAVGCPTPMARMTTLFSNEMQLPYFNSGVVAVDTTLSQDLYREWWDCFHRINRSGAMKDNPYFREQVSLSVAVIRMGIPYDVLGEYYNFWVKAKPIDPLNPPLFLHHTWPHPPLYHQPLLRDLVRSLVRPYAGMDKILSHCRWCYYLQPEFIVDLHRARFRATKLYQNIMVQLRYLVIEERLGLFANTNGNQKRA